MVNPKDKMRGGLPAALDKVMGTLKSGPKPKDLPATTQGNPLDTQATALEKARQDAKSLAAMLPDTARVNPNFGPGVRPAMEKLVRPVAKVEEGRPASQTKYENILQQLSTVMRNDNIVSVAPYLFELDRAAKAAGIPQEQIVADVRTQLSDWENGRGVPLATKLRDTYARYGLLDDAVEKRLKEVEAPGGAAMKERLAQKFDAGLRRLSQVATGDMRSGVPTIARLESMYDNVKGLSGYTADPKASLMNARQAFNDAVIRVAPILGEQNQADFSNCRVGNIWNRNHSIGLTSFLERYRGELSPEATKQVADIVKWLRDHKI